MPLGRRPIRPKPGFSDSHGLARVVRPAVVVRFGFLVVKGAATAAAYRLKLVWSVAASAGLWTQVERAGAPRLFPSLVLLAPVRRWEAALCAKTVVMGLPTELERAATYHLCPCPPSPLPHSREHAWILLFSA